MDDGTTGEQHGARLRDHPRWLTRGEARRESKLAHYLLSNPAMGHEELEALEAQLAEERERRIEIERRLVEQAGLLDALHAEVALTRRGASPGSLDGEGPTASGPLKVVELGHECVAAGRDSWLRRCESFDVEIESVSVGWVDELRFGRRHDCPDALIVATGRWLRRPVFVPVEHVEAISGEEERVTLSAAARELFDTSEPGARRPLLRAVARKLDQLHPDIT